MQNHTEYMNELKELVVNYYRTRILLAKFDLYEKVAKVTASLFTSFLIASFLLLTLFFLTMSAGFYFGELFNSNALGFLTVAGIFLLLLSTTLYFKYSWLEKIIIDRVIAALTEKDDIDDDDVDDLLDFTPTNTPGEEKEKEVVS